MDASFQSFEKFAALLFQASLVRRTPDKTPSGKQSHHMNYDAADIGVS
jgi:hypothetical protein